MPRLLGSPMTDRLANGFTRLTYLDGDQTLLGRADYERVAQAFLTESPARLEVTDVYGCDAVIRVSEVREVLDVTPAAYAENQAEQLRGGA